MDKKTTKQFYEYYNRWVRPFVIDKGDNLLESEGQLHLLLNLVKKECARKLYTILIKNPVQLKVIRKCQKTILTNKGDK